MYGRIQNWAKGDRTGDFFNETDVREPVIDGMTLTGSNRNPAYDEETMFDRTKELQMLDNHYLHFFDNHQKWVIPEITEELVDKCVEMLRAVNSQNVWERVFKDFPALRKPLTADVQREFWGFYLDVVPHTADEELVAKKAAPFLVEMYETKYIQFHYWWRIEEAIVAEMEKLPSVQEFEKHACHRTMERVTKILLNTLGSQPGMHSMLGSAFQDVTAFRPSVEAGLW